MSRSRFWLAGWLVLVGLGLVRAGPPIWVVPSPTHRQTFAFGSERHQEWIERGGHLALSAGFTNDPYVDNVNIRQYDDFVFDFPAIHLGADGRTFSYRTPLGHLVPVAIRHRRVFGCSEIELLPNSLLIVHRPHGFLSLAIVLGPPPGSLPDDGF